MKREQFNEIIKALLDGAQHEDPTVNFVVNRIRQARTNYARASMELSRAEQLTAKLRDEVTQLQGLTNGYAFDLEELLGLEREEVNDAGRRQRQGAGGNAKGGGGDQAGDGKHVEGASA